MYKEFNGKIFDRTIDRINAQDAIAKMEVELQDSKDYLDSLREQESKKLKEIEKEEVAKIENEFEINGFEKNNNLTYKELKDKLN